MSIIFIIHSSFSTCVAQSYHMGLGWGKSLIVQSLYHQCILSLQSQINPQLHLVVNNSNDVFISILHSPAFLSYPPSLSSEQKLDFLCACSRVHNVTTNSQITMPNISAINQVPDPSSILCIAGQPLYLSSVDTYQVPYSSCYKILLLYWSSKSCPFSEAQKKLSSSQLRGQLYGHELVCIFFKSSMFFCLHLHLHTASQLSPSEGNAYQASQCWIFDPHYSKYLSFAPIFVPFLHHTGMCKPCQSEKYFVTH